MWKNVRKKLRVVKRNHTIKLLVQVYIIEAVQVLIIKVMAHLKKDLKYTKEQ